MVNNINPNQDKLNLLNTITPQGETEDAADDISNYTPPDLSASQLQAYQAQYQPAFSPLPTNAYYPNIGHNVGVGNYAGSEIGSTTLFAPGGALVPFAAIDARDAAVKGAAAKKARDIENFRKAYQSPTTKHVVVQKDLTEAYNKGLQQWNQNALKKSGGDQALANQMLMQDPNFTAWNKSMQDFAKYHDALVDKYAQFQKDMKDPNVVVSPETQKYGNDLMSSAAYHGGSPFSKEARDFENKFLGFSANYDVDKTVNTAIDKAIPNIEQLPPEYVTRGKNETATYLEKEFFTPEARKELAHNIFMEKFQGTGVTEEQVQKNVDAKLGEKIKRKTDTYDKYYKPEPKVEPDYSNAVETTARFNVNTGEGTKEAHLQSFIPLTAAHEKQELSFPINKGTKDLGDPELQDKTGSFKGTVSGFGIAYRDKATGKISTLTPEEVATQKENKTFNHNLEAIPIAMVNKKGAVAPLPTAQLNQLKLPLQVDDGEGGTREETEAETQERVNSVIAQHNADQESKLNKLVPVPIEQVEGKYPKKSGQKVSVDDKIKQVRQKAESENQQAASEASIYRDELKKDPAKLKEYNDRLLDHRKSADDKSGVTEKNYSVKGKAYPESAIKKAAEASGMTIDEYLKAVSK